MSTVSFMLLIFSGAAMFLMLPCFSVFISLRPDYNSPPALQKRTERLWKHLQFVSSSQLFRLPDVYKIRLLTDRELDDLFPPNIVHRNIDSHVSSLLLNPLTSLTSLSISLHLFSEDKMKMLFFGLHSSWMLTLGSVDTESLEDLQSSSACWLLRFVQMGSKLCSHFWSSIFSV